MKKNYLFLFVLFVTVFIPYHLQAQGAETFRQEGIASWYGKEFDGRPTASGEIYDASKMTAAHPSLPFGTMVVVTNLHNNKKVTVRVNDRGPFVAARVIDISKAAAEQLDMVATGTAPVMVESVDRIVVSSQISQQAVSQPVSAQPTAQPVVSNVTAVPVYQTYTQQPAAASDSYHIRLTPDIIIAHNKTYRLQVGSYKIAKNAVDAYERLKNSGLNPAYERHEDSGKGEFFRVVLSGIPGNEISSVAEKLKASGFKEAVIREEN